jgi:hypothetical protein
MRRFLVCTTFSFLVLSGCDATTPPPIITSTGEFPLFNGLVTVKIFQTSGGGIRYTVAHRNANGTETMGPQAKAIRKGPPWCIFVEDANNLWVFDGERDVMLVEYSGIHTTVSGLASVPDLLRRAPRQFLDRLPAELRRERT